MARRCLVTILCLAWATAALAQAPRPKTNDRAGFWRGGNCCPSLGCCADDYDRKPFPCIIPLARCGGPDDYCRKPQPCIIPIPRCGGCDDYCRKPLPSLLCPPCLPNLNCGPTTLERGQCGATLRLRPILD
jgi:hypothetical protein